VIVEAMSVALVEARASMMGLIAASHPAVRTSASTMTVYDAKLQQRAVTETGRAMFRCIPLKVRQTILDRLKKLAAEAETEIAHAKDHTHLRAGIMKMAAVTAMIEAVTAKRRVWHLAP
jgi:hypothetical protein